MGFRETAIRAAKEAGKIHLKYFRKKFEIRYKAYKHNRVTIADTEAEKKIVSEIRKEYPSHNILAEEAEYPRTGSEYLWVIDPLDGTNNFSKGIPVFCVSIALAKDNELILGVIYDPTRNELFVAEKGKGAFLNGKRIKVSGSSQLHDSILLTGFYYDRGKPMFSTLASMQEFFLKDVIGIRCTGSAALDLCSVASGRVDGFWELQQALSW